MALAQLDRRRRELEATLERFRKVYKNSPIGYVTLDSQSRIVDLNAAAARLLSARPEGLLGLSFTTLVSASSCTTFLDNLSHLRRTAGAPVVTELELIAGTRRRVPVQAVTSVVPLETSRLFETALIDLTAQRASADAAVRAREYSDSIVTTIPYPVLVLDKRGCVIGANAAFYSTFLTNQESVISWPINELPDVQWQTPGLDRLLMRTLAKGGVLNDFHLHASLRNGANLIFSAHARPITPHAREAAFLLVALEDITQRRRAEEEREQLLLDLRESQTRLEARVEERTQQLAKSYGRLRELGEQLVLAHEQEQRRIARELHDQVGQDLTALKLVLRRGKTASVEEMRRTLQEAESLTDELLATVRGICGTLRPQVLDDLGLIAGLEWHFKTFGARTGVDVAFEHGPFDEASVDRMTESTIFRVIQEALTNVSRHAATNKALVTLTRRNDLIEFSIRDWGKGFDPTEVMKQASTGLSSMRERLALVNGNFEISSSPGKGTIITGQIPAPAETNQPTNQNRIQNGQRSPN
jgi:PAS domain S-box-containing protein